MANEYRVTQVAVEVLHSGSAQARVSQVAIEVLRTITTSTSSRRRQIVN